MATAVILLKFMIFVQIIYFKTYGFTIKSDHGYKINCNYRVSYIFNQCKIPNSIYLLLYFVT